MTAHALTDPTSILAVGGGIASGSERGNALFPIVAPWSFVIIVAGLIAMCFTRSRVRGQETGSSCPQRDCPRRHTVVQKTPCALFPTSTASCPGSFAGPRQLCADSRSRRPYSGGPHARPPFIVRSAPSIAFEDHNRKLRVHGAATSRGPPDLRGGLLGKVDRVRHGLSVRVRAAAHEREAQRQSTWPARELDREVAGDPRRFPGEGVKVLGLLRVRGALTRDRDKSARRTRRARTATCAGRRSASRRAPRRRPPSGCHRRCSMPRLPGRRPSPP